MGYIDWTPLFHAWELKGIYPKILDHPKWGDRARELLADAQALLEDIVSGNELRARGVYGFFPAAADGDDIVVFDDSGRARERARFHMLRQQQMRGDARELLCLSDFVAPLGAADDHLGAFAVTAGIGLDDVVARFEADHDDYRAIMAKALADRLAEAFAELLHQRARADWGYGAGERLTPDDLIHERYRGIRPAFGYPACPDHSEKRTLWSLLDAEARTGVRLTESCAMFPTASVSGIYFGGEVSRYFSVGRIARDQVEDYARRKGMSIVEVERWLAPNLGYDD